MHGYCNPAANKDLKYTMKKTQTMYVYVYTHPVKAYDVHMLKWSNKLKAELLVK